MIADMVSNKKLYPIVTGLFIRRRKLNISLVCVMHYFVMKIPNKRELQQIAFSHWSDIDFMNFLKKCTGKPYFFLVIDTTLVSDNSSGFRKNLLERT